MGIICGVLLFFIRIPVLSLYQLSPETREMANTFLIILSVVMVGMSYQMPTNGGIIRGSGSIAYSMKVDLISTWAIVIPLSMFMAFVVKASPAIVVCCLNADQIFKCVPAFLKCNYGHWINHDKYFLTPVLPVGRIKDKVLCAKGKFRIEFQDKLDKNMRI